MPKVGYLMPDISNASLSPGMHTFFTLIKKLMLPSRPITVRITTTFTCFSGEVRTSLRRTYGTDLMRKYISL